MQDCPIVRHIYLRPKGASVDDLPLTARTIEPGPHLERERRRRDKEETRARVMDAARRLFAREGFQRVTIRMIAEEAKVATGSVFITFTSKDELCGEIVSEYLVGLGQDVSEAAAKSAGQPVVDRLIAMAGATLAFPPERLSFMREMVASAWTYDEGAERKLRASIAPVGDTLMRVLQNAVKEGELRAGADVAMLAEVLANIHIAGWRTAIYEGLSTAQQLSKLRAQAEMVLAAARP